MCPYNSLPFDSHLPGRPTEEWYPNCNESATDLVSGSNFLEFYLGSACKENGNKCNIDNQRLNFEKICDSFRKKVGK